MKKIIGQCIATIGARLWTKGGFHSAKCYEELTVTGKLGYKMCCSGLSLMGVTWEQIKNMKNQ